MVPFINKYSAKCMLGKLSKAQKQNANVFSWVSQNKKHVVIIDDEVDEASILRLKEIGKANFHYLSEKSINQLKNHLHLTTSKGKSVILGIRNINFSGNKNKGFRNYLNRYSEMRIESNLNKFDDLIVMLNRWSDTLGKKYFRDMSSKNKFFIENNYHKDCENLFIYNKDNELVSFGIVSPVESGKCSYIMGKALSNIYPGLADFTDLKVYEKIFEKYGSFEINMGQSERGLLAYKMKFPGANIQIHYHGKYEA